MFEGDNKSPFNSELWRFVKYFWKFIKTNMKLFLQLAFIIIIFKFGIVFMFLEFLNCSVSRHEKI